jgi:AcrR family transcriptional regulator
MTARIDVSALRREQIVSVVRDIIVRESLESVTIARIASEAGVSRGVVTYHFESKEEIIHEAVRAAMHDANKAADALAVEGSAHDLASLAERVAALGGSGNDWWHIYVALLGLAERDSFMRSELAWANRYYRAALARMVGSDARATILLAVLQGLAMQRLVGGDEALGDITAELVSLLEHWYR